MIRRDLGFYAFIFGYAGLVGLIAIAIGEPDKFIPLVYFPRWIRGLFGVAALLVAYAALSSLTTPQPFRSFIDRVKSVMTRQTASGVCLFLGLALFHGVFTSMKTMLPDIGPFRWDQPLAEIDAALHGGQDPWLFVRFLDPVTGILNFLYAQTWFALIALSSLLVCTWPKLKEARSQFLWTFLLCWSLLGNLIAGLFLSGGPMFYRQITGSERFAPVIDRLGEGEGFPPHRYAQALWLAYERDIAGIATGISAFPSMHLSMATLFCLVAFRVHRNIGIAMIIYLGIIMLGSVHLGWHYAIDGYFSILATVGVWKLVGYAIQPQMRMAYA